MRRAETGSFLAGWPAVEEACKALAEHIDRRWDCIVAVGRGGLVPAALLAQFAGIERVHCLNIHKERRQEGVRVEPWDLPVRGKRVVLVDDSVNTGQTLRAAREACEGSGARKVMAMALWCRDTAGCTGVCDHAFLSDGDVVFPWEFDERPDRDRGATWAAPACLPRARDRRHPPRHSGSHRADLPARCLPDSGR